MTEDIPIPEWRLDDLETENRRKELDALKAFVGWLVDNGVAAPTCWYTHGWMLHRLAAMLDWWVHLTDGKDAAAWWAEMQNITDSREWVSACTHGLTHLDPATGERDRYGSFEELVDRLCGAPATEVAS